MTRETITLNPKARFLANPAVASAHSDLMASPAFQQAAATALLTYQYRLGAGDAQVLALSFSKLRGAQEFLREMMNLGLPDTMETTSVDSSLTPPEDFLDRPYEPPK
jgi:hypothetical protein